MLIREVLRARWSSASPERQTEAVQTEKAADAACREDRDVFAVIICKFVR